MLTTEAALVIPMALILVFVLLLASPLLYADSVRAARDAVAETRSSDPIRPDAPILAILAASDSLSILSGSVPGLGGFLAALGGVREGEADEGPGEEGT